MWQDFIVWCQNSDFRKASQATKRDASLRACALQVSLALREHFARNTYDLLRKNCNTFSDVALAFLLGRRLDPKYNQVRQGTVA